MLITPSAPTDDQRWRSVEVRMGQLGHRPEGLIEVLHTVQEIFGQLADTDVLTGHQLTPELAEDIATARLAVLIDASLGDTPGCVSIREVAPAPGLSWSHHLRPEDVVGLAHALFGAAPQVFLVTVTGAHFGYGTQLSPAVSDCMSRVLTIVKAALQPSPIDLRSR